MQNSKQSLKLSKTVFCCCFSLKIHISLILSEGPHPRRHKKEDTEETFSPIFALLPSKFSTPQGNAGKMQMLM